MSQRTRRSVVGLAAATLVAAGLPLATTAPTNAQPAPVQQTASTQAAAPEFKPAAGLTNVAQEQMTERTVRVTYSSDQVGTTMVSAEDKKLSSVITLPKGYDASKKYPVLFLLHGHPGNAVNGFNTAELEKITADKGLILVRPEGGSGSWYTDWKDQRHDKANWESHHIDEVIPFIDANLATYGDGAHRAIGGYSMGGYGAVHYGFKHPDLFNHVASYSGGVDLEDQTIRVAVAGSAGQFNGYQPIQPLDGTGPFGPWVWPNDTGWKDENPVRHADKLRGTNVTLYAGSGSNDADILERGAGWSTNTLHKRLNALDIDNHFDMYGRNVEYGGYSCNGGHTADCFHMAFSKDIDRIMTSIGNNG